MPEKMVNLHLLLYLQENRHQILGLRVTFFYLLVLLFTVDLSLIYIDKIKKNKKVKGIYHTVTDQTWSSKQYLQVIHEKGWNVKLTGVDRGQMGNLLSK